jgi:hypothetical protein
MRLLLPAICLVLAAFPLPGADHGSAASPVGARTGADLARLLGAADAAALALEGRLVRVVPRDAAPAWLPAVDSRDAILAEVRRVDPTIAVELLRWYGGLSIRFDTPEGRLRLFNALRAVGTMQGLTYWSASRGVERVLFTESHAVAGPDAPAPLPDPVDSLLPATDRRWSLQVDQTFGRHLYVSTYTNRSDHLVARTENADTISYLLIPVMRPGGMVTMCMLVPLPDGVLLAGLVWSKLSVPAIDRAGREASLLNRLVALSNWVGTRLAAP